VIWTFSRHIEGHKCIHNIKWEAMKGKIQFRNACSDVCFLKEWNLRGPDNVRRTTLLGNYN
jgi:hypothetical protein